MFYPSSSSSHADIAAAWSEYERPKINDAGGDEGKSSADPEL
jgi:hypothetical protein